MSKRIDEYMHIYNLTIMHQDACAYLEFLLSYNKLHIWILVNCVYSNNNRYQIKFIKTLKY